MSTVGDALKAVKSVILIEERMGSLSSKIDRLVDQVDGFSTRLTRLETIVEIARPEGATLRIAPHGGGERR